MQQDSGALPELEIAFYLLGDIPEAENLELLFGVKPSVSRTRGEARIRRSTGEVVGTHWESEWGFTSGAAVTSNEILAHVAWLLSKASPATRLLATLPHVRAFIEVALANGSSTVLPSELVKFASELKAEIGIVARSIHAA